MPHDADRDDSPFAKGTRFFATPRVSGISHGGGSATLAELGRLQAAQGGTSPAWHARSSSNQRKSKSPKKIIKSLDAERDRWQAAGSPPPAPPSAAKSKGPSVDLTSDTDDDDVKEGQGMGHTQPKDAGLARGTFASATTVKGADASRQSREHPNSKACGRDVGNAARGAVALGPHGAPKDKDDTDDGDFVMPMPATKRGNGASHKGHVGTLGGMPAKEGAGRAVVGAVASASLLVQRSSLLDNMKDKDGRVGTAYRNPSSGAAKQSSSSSAPPIAFNPRPGAATRSTQRGGAPTMRGDGANLFASHECLSMEDGWQDVHRAVVTCGRVREKCFDGCQMRYDQRNLHLHLRCQGVSLPPEVRVVKLAEVTSWLASRNQLRNPLDGVTKIEIMRDRDRDLMTDGGETETTVTLLLARELQSRLLATINTLCLSKHLLWTCSIMDDGEASRYRGFANVTELSPPSSPSLEVEEEHDEGEEDVKEGGEPTAASGRAPQPLQSSSGAWDVQRSLGRADPGSDARPVLGKRPLSFSTGSTGGDARPRQSTPPPNKRRSLGNILQKPLKNIFAVASATRYDTRSTTTSCAKREPPPASVTDLSAPLRTGTPRDAMGMRLPKLVLDPPLEYSLAAEGGGGAATSIYLETSDVDRLQPRQFLNDALIDFYVRFVQNELDEPLRRRCHFFNSFFFTKLRQQIQPHTLVAAASSGDDGGSGAAALIKPGVLCSPSAQAKVSYARVQRWARNVDVFSKDFIFVPVNQSCHWSLAIICHPRRAVTGPSAKGEKACIFHLDSLRGTHTGVAQHLRSYLLQAWRDPDRERGELASLEVSDEQFHSNLEEACPLVPQQDNYCDCGLFLLFYLEQFAKSPACRRGDLAAIRSMLTSAWFDAVEVYGMRGELHAKIASLHEAMLRAQRDKGEVQRDKGEAAPGGDKTPGADTAARRPPSPEGSPLRPLPPHWQHQQRPGRSAGALGEKGERGQQQQHQQGKKCSNDKPPAGTPSGGWNTPQATKAGDANADEGGAPASGKKAATAASTFPAKKGVSASVSPVVAACGDRAGAGASASQDGCGAATCPLASHGEPSSSQDVVVVDERPELVVAPGVRVVPPGHPGGPRSKDIRKCGTHVLGCDSQGGKAGRRNQLLPLSATMGEADAKSAEAKPSGLMDQAPLLRGGRVALVAGQQGGDVPISSTQPLLGMEVPWGGASGGLLGQRGKMPGGRAVAHETGQGGPGRAGQGGPGRAGRGEGGSIPAAAAAAVGSHHARGEERPNLGGEEGDEAEEVVMIASIKEVVANQRNKKVAAKAATAANAATVTAATATATQANMHANKHAYKRVNHLADKQAGCTRGAAPWPSESGASIISDSEGEEHVRGGEAEAKGARKGGSDGEGDGSEVPWDVPGTKGGQGATQPQQGALSMGMGARHAFRDRSNGGGEVAPALDGPHGRAGNNGRAGASGNGVTMPRGDCVGDYRDHNGYSDPGNDEPGCAPGNGPPYSDGLGLAGTNTHKDSDGLGLAGTNTHQGTGGGGGLGGHETKGTLPGTAKSAMSLIRSGFEPEVGRNKHKPEVSSKHTNKKKKPSGGEGGGAHARGGPGAAQVDLVLEEGRSDRGRKQPAWGAVRVAAEDHAARVHVPVDRSKRVAARAGQGQRVAVSASAGARVAVDLVDSSGDEGEGKGEGKGEGAGPDGNMDEVEGENDEGEGDEGGQDEGQLLGSDDGDREGGAEDRSQGRDGDEDQQRRRPASSVLSSMAAAFARLGKRADGSPYATASSLGLDRPAGLPGGAAGSNAQGSNPAAIDRGRRAPMADQEDAKGMTGQTASGKAQKSKQRAGWEEVRVDSADDEGGSVDRVVSKTGRATTPGTCREGNGPSHRLANSMGRHTGERQGEAVVDLTDDGEGRDGEGRLVDGAGKSGAKSAQGKSWLAEAGKKAAASGLKRAGGANGVALGGRNGSKVARLSLTPGLKHVGGRKVAVEDEEDSDCLEQVRLTPVADDSDCDADDVLCRRLVGRTG
eukprot:jgi/Mesvir1/507/Mv11371-RA.2